MRRITSFPALRLRALMDRPCAATSASIRGSSSGTDFSVARSPIREDSRGLSQRSSPTHSGQLI